MGTNPVTEYKFAIVIPTKTMRLLVFFLAFFLSTTAVSGQRRNNCEMKAGLDCGSVVTLQPGDSYTIQNKSCKNGKIPRNEICWWEFNFKGCIPKVHCDYVDIKGRGKRCCGDSLRMVVFPWMRNVCDVQESFDLSPGLSEDGATQIQRPLHVVFTTDEKKKKKQRKGFKCEMTCEEPGPEENLTGESEES